MKKKIFELGGCLGDSGGGLIATQSREQRQKVMGVEEGKKKKHSSTYSCTLSYALIHPAGIFKEDLLSKSSPFPPLAG